MITLRATSFATRQDLAAYAVCRINGHSDSYCTSTDGGGDNGQGAWGDETWRTDLAYCALGKSLWSKHQKVRVSLFDETGTQVGKTFICIQGDKGNEGVIDLNPGSLILAGLDPDTELDLEAQVELL